MLNVKQLVAGVKDLVSLPEIYLKIRELYADSESSIKDFEKVVSTDPGLCARVLRIGNSAFFGFATKIDNVARALMIMGTAQLHDLVLATSAISAFDGIPNDEVDMNIFWRRSVHCGVMARLLGTHCNMLDTDRLFLTGLLHDIGHLIMYSQIPEQSREVIAHARNTEQAVYLVERELLGFDYAELGSELMRDWALADTIIEPVEHHLTPGKAHQFLMEACVIHVANALAIADELGDPRHPQVPTIAPLVWQTTGLEQECLPEIVEESMGHLDEAVSLFVPSKPLRVASNG